MTTLSTLLTNYSEIHGSITININSDFTLDTQNGNVQILKPSDNGYVCTLPMLNDVVILALVNDSDYDLNIKLKSDNTYTVLPASKSGKFFFNEVDTWYAIINDTVNLTQSDIGRPINNISAGNENIVYAYNNSGRQFGLAVLDSTHIVIAYSDRAHSYRGVAVVGTISGNTIAFGSQQIFTTHNVSYIDAVTLDSTHVVIAYEDISNSAYGTVIIGTVSGNSISYSSTSIFNYNTTYHIKLTALNSSNIVVIYDDEGFGGKGKGRVGVISGSTITFGSSDVISSSVKDNYNLKVTTLDSTHVAVLFNEDSTGNNDGKIIPASISGNSISFQVEKIIDNYYISNMSCVALDSTHVFISFADTTYPNDEYGTAVIATYDGSSFTIGPKYVFEYCMVIDMAVTKLDSTHVVITYYANDRGEGKTIIGTVSGNDISFGLPDTFNYGNISCLKVETLDSNHAVTIYEDDSNSNYSTSCVLTKI